MKSKILLFGLAFSSIFISGCLRTYYPAIYKESAFPMIFEKNDSDSIISKYVSADLLLSKGSYGAESLYLLKGSYIISKTTKHFNTNIKFFGYSGMYKVSGLAEYNGKNYNDNKNFIGLGTDLGLNINFKINKFKMGLGLSIGLGSEFGEYYNFRESAKNANIIKSEISLFNFAFSVFPIFAYRFSESTVLSSQINIGIPGILSPSIVLNSNDYIYWLSILPNFNSKDKYLGERIVLGFMINLNKLNFAL